MSTPKPTTVPQGPQTTSSTADLLEELLRRGNTVHICEDCRWEVRRGKRQRWRENKRRRERARYEAKMEKNGQKVAESGRNWQKTTRTTDSYHGITADDMPGNDRLLQRLNFTLFQRGKLPGYETCKDLHGQALKDEFTRLHAGQRRKSEQARLKRKEAACHTD